MKNLILTIALSFSSISTLQAASYNDSLKENYGTPQVASNPVCSDFKSAWQGCSSVISAPRFEPILKGADAHRTLFMNSVFASPNAQSEYRFFENIEKLFEELSVRDPRIMITSKGNADFMVRVYWRSHSALAGTVPNGTLTIYGHFNLNSDAVKIEVTNTVIESLGDDSDIELKGRVVSYKKPSNDFDKLRMFAETGANSGVTHEVNEEYVKIVTFVLEKYFNNFLPDNSNFIQKITELDKLSSFVKP